jgi:GNAT superfamily N-acetyltransferase
MRTLPKGCALRPLESVDLPALMQLYAEVMAALPDPSLFRLFGGPEAFFSSHWGQRGESFGVFLGARALAYGSLTRPQPSDADNYAGNLQWPPERAGRVGLLSAGMVAPEQRGQGLHVAVIQARLALAAELGLPELLARASPANALSRQTLMEQGFAIAWLGVQAGGLLRHVFWRPCLAPASLRAEAPITWVGPEEHSAQQACLAAGLLGLKLRRSDGAIGFGASDSDPPPAHRASAAGH